MLELSLESTLVRWLGLIVCPSSPGEPLSDLADGGEGAWALYMQSGDREIDASHASRIGVLAERGWSGFEEAGNYRIDVTFELMTGVDDTAHAGESRATIHGNRVRALEIALSAAARPVQLGAMNSVASGLVVDTYGLNPDQPPIDGRDEHHHATQLRYVFHVAALEAGVV